MLNNGMYHEPTPGPACLTFADLLPLLGEPTLAAAQASKVRAHLATCEYCQQQQAAYQRIETNLRRHFDTLPSLRFSPEEIMSLTEDTRPAEPASFAAPAPLQPPRARRARRVISIFSALAAVLIIAVVVAAILASRGGLPRNTPTANPGHSRATATPTLPIPQETPYHPNPDGDLLSQVQMLSPSEGWAVGGAYQNGSSLLILHYSNGQWKRMQAPTNAELGLPNAEIQSIAMVSADEGWAVGAGDFSSRIPSAFILHYSAGRWTKFSVQKDAELWSVQMLSPTDGWASGGGGWGTEQGATTSILLHYNGKDWTQVQAPNVAGITSLDMRSSSDGWATGTNAILHYNGHQWSVFQRIQGVYGLSMDSASDGWAIGFINYPYNHTNSSNVVWHYNGRTWVQGSLPSAVNADAQLLAISMDSASDGWAVGYGNGDKGQARYSLYLHYTQGHWVLVQGPGSDNINGVTMLSADDGWAVGNGGVVLHYQHGSWSQYHF